VEEPPHSREDIKSSKARTARRARRARRGRRAVEEPPHSREVIRPRKARTARRGGSAVEEPPHSREVIRPRKARTARRGGSAVEEPRAAFACPLKRLSTSCFTGIGLKEGNDLRERNGGHHSTSAGKPTTTSINNDSGELRKASFEEMDACHLSDLP
jgi:hypothetical protein